jgi:hypothetical protein
MNLIALSIGYIFLALADILPRFIKSQEKGSFVAFCFAIMSLIIFVVTLINIYR